MSRIFDFCLAQHPLAILYVAAAVIIKQNQEIYEMEDYDVSHFVCAFGRACSYALRFVLCVL